MLNQKKHILSGSILLLFYTLFVATTVDNPGQELADPVLTAYDSTLKRGQYTFCTYCVHCHKISSQAVAENSLNGVFDRLPKPANEYFIKFVGDSKLLREQGDQYAQSIHAAWNSRYSHKFNQLFSDAEFTDLLTYIQHHTK